MWNTSASSGRRASPPPGGAGQCKVSAHPGQSLPLLLHLMLVGLEEGEVKDGERRMVGAMWRVEDGGWKWKMKDGKMEVEGGT